MLAPAHIHLVAIALPVAARKKFEDRIVAQIEKPTTQIGFFTFSGEEVVYGILFFSFNLLNKEK
ncbi:hypothetical protein [Mycoplasmopsis synoviae]|uniref:hypothetical protein n=1 Tax=Mycoplasmopsis synoviae TaxID=2109 RepID=UPI0034DB3362